MAINTPPTAVELQNAGTDLDTLDKVMNGAADLSGTGIVSTRRGGPVRTLAWYLAQIDESRLEADALVADLSGRTSAIALLASLLAPGQPLDVLVENLNDAIAASGIYPLPLGAHDALEGETINDPRVTVTREEERDGNTVTVRYRPRALPFTVTDTFDPQDWYEMASQGALPETVLARLRRLETFHPPVAPVFAGDARYNVLAGSTGVIVDLNTLVTDPDSPPANRVFTALAALPTGFSLDGGVLSCAAPPVQAAMDVTFRVTDESGQSDDIVITLQVYDEASPPVTPPSFGGMSLLTLTQGVAMAPRNARSSIIAGTTPLASLIVTASGVPAGLTAIDGVLSGTPTVSGSFVILWSAEDAFGNVAEYAQAVLVSAAAAPVWASIPAITIYEGTTLPPVRYDQYLNPAPYAASQVSLSLSGTPFGTALTARELRGVINISGSYLVTVTATNPAGGTASIQHRINVLPYGTGTVGGGGSTGGGSGGRENVNLF